MQRLNDWFFSNDVSHIQTSFGYSPKTLAESVVDLALSGSHGDLWALLRKQENGEAALAELVVLYLYASDRVAAEFFSLVEADAATRDLFFNDVAQHTRDLLAGRVSDADFAGQLMQLLDERRSEYQRCRQLYRSEGTPLEGTVTFAFYKHLLRFGRETAILVLSELQLHDVERRVVNAFASVADRAAAESTAAATTTN